MVMTIRTTNGSTRKVFTVRGSPISVQHQITRLDSSTLSKMRLRFC
jgi:hypothetical protein